MERYLILEDGTVFAGTAFGAEKDATGEVIFNTSMTGYQEIITDPANFDKLVMFTYPLIGNYGFNRDDFEAIEPTLKGIIVKEAADFPSNWRSEMSLDTFLQQKGIPGISGIDTRMLMRHIRNNGLLKGKLCNSNVDIESELERLRALQLPTDQVKRVSTNKPFPSPGRGSNIVLIDLGFKNGILRELNMRDCDVTVVPYDESVTEIMTLHPDGVIISNGPGNPKDVLHVADVIKELMSDVPIMGIGLGHLLFALANGADTSKLPLGCHGSSYPVKNIETGKVFFTVQNNEYTVIETSLQQTRLNILYKGLNDGNVVGLKHKDYPSLSVQFYPEASPGVEDATYLFDDFLQKIRERKGKETNNA